MEDKQALTSGKHTIEFAFTYDGPGIGKGGTGVLKFDGKEVANHRVPAHHPVAGRRRRVLRHRGGAARDDAVQVRMGTFAVAIFIL